MRLARLPNAIQSNPPEGSFKGAIESDSGGEGFAIAGRRGIS